MKVRAEQPENARPSVKARWTSGWICLCRCSVAPGGGTAVERLEVRACAAGLYDVIQQLEDEVRLMIDAIEQVWEGEERSRGN